MQMPRDAYEDDVEGDDTAAAVLAEDDRAAPVDSVATGVGFASAEDDGVASTSGVAPVLSSKELDPVDSRTVAGGASAPVESTGSTPAPVASAVDESDSIADVDAAVSNGGTSEPPDEDCSQSVADATSVLLTSSIDPESNVLDSRAASSPPTPVEPSLDCASRVTVSATVVTAGTEDGQRRSISLCDSWSDCIRRRALGVIVAALDSPPPVDEDISHASASSVMLNVSSLSQGTAHALEQPSRVWEALSVHVS